ncbi:cardiolipin synthase [Acidocella aminolytica 101 = DSM 11237]|nr:cardiolipin synthase [Acidocella aminolytica 101 = DSM 11237]
MSMDMLEALAGHSFYRVAEGWPSTGNLARLLKDGPQTYAAWLEAIERAEKFVNLENYIFQEDSTGEKFARALLAAAARGIRCRLLYDWLGCRNRTSSSFWQKLRDGGVEVRCYNAPQLLHPLRWISRDHRKVLCVDGVLAFTGGLCIGHDWVGDPAKGIPPWRDTAIELKGPAVGYIDAAFEDSWLAAHEGRGLATGVPPPVSGQECVPGLEVSVIAGRPDSMGLYRLEQLVAEIVQHSLWLTDGYFVATTAYVRALSGAAQAGVDVRLLVPGSSDMPLVGALSKSAYRPLLEAGVRVFEWNGPMVHAKTAVADGCWTRIGSSNSNLASWITNRELDVTIKSQVLARQMEAMFESDMANSTEVVLMRGVSGLRRPVASSQHGRSAGKNTRRLFSGAIGLSSTLAASFTKRRVLGPEEALVLLSGGAGLILLGLAVLLLPQVFAGLFGIAAIAPGIGLLLRAIRLWRSGLRSHGR